MIEPVTKVRPQARDLTGQRFGRVVVLRFAWKTYRHPNGIPHLLWECRCDCGKEWMVKGPSLVSGNTTSCGCSRLKSDEEQRLLARYQQSARRRGYTFTLSTADFRQLVSHPCVYCGSLSRRLNGLDRVDNSRGYERGNCLPCCRVCNVAKAQMSIQEFAAWIKRVYEKGVWL